MTCGNYTIAVSPAEAARLRARCSCGKIVKLRPSERLTRENLAYVTRHNAPKGETK